MRLRIPLLLCVTLFVSNGLGKRQTRRNNGSKQEDFQKALPQLKILQKLGRAGGLNGSALEGITKYDKDVCYDQPCLDSAKEILESTNFQKDPCKPDVWYDFVCARRVNQVDNRNRLVAANTLVIERTRAILEDKWFPGFEKEKADDFLLKEAQVYYHQCLKRGRQNSKDVPDLLKYLSKTYGDWPMITNRDPGPKFNWLNLVADLNRIDNNLQNNHFQPMFLQLSLGETIVLNAAQVWPPVTQADYNATVRAITFNKTEPDETHLAGMINFLIAVGRSYEYDIPRRLTVQQLQTESNKYMKEKGQNNLVNWGKLLKRILKGTNIQVTPNTTITAPVKTIISVMEAVERYKLSDPRSVSNALNLQLASVLLQESTDIFDNIPSFMFTREYGYRENICYARTTEIFGLSLGRTYLSLYYNDTIDAPKIHEMMRKIQNGYIRAIEASKLMSTKTQNYLKDKILDMKTFVSQPDWTRDPDKLKSYYSGMNASKGTVLYPRNYLSVNQWKTGKVREWKHKMSKADATKNYTGCDIYDLEWSMYLGTVNAQYHKMFNDARVIGGIIQTPLFGADRPGFMNYGGLGTVLGHEIGHSFDTTGIQYDKEGQLNATKNWDEESLKGYVAWTQNILNEYSKEGHQTSETSAETRDSSHTLNEDISDLLGLEMTFLAYQDYLKELNKTGSGEKVLPGLKDFTPEKLFYMQYSNSWCEKLDWESHYNQLYNGVHSPPNVRATLPPKRSRRFSDTFDCPMPTGFTY